MNNSNLNNKTKLNKKVKLNSIKKVLKVVKALHILIQPSFEDSMSIQINNISKSHCHKINPYSLC